ncbi:putative oligopeptide ABC transporter, permease protein OppC [Halobacteriovorax sp. BALOs_7]|uniref:ABC transporter permease n=1 Tax=Halobacteriovorax sp. BALOs_7 TaxID=2109558 RepID=UPI000EA156E6|nr:ABC transporter permease [Halobacteriovorax sp. BALOs_7]AYF45658.1 putative oligopeptide ABC transporter, permease protein OppC [Halobacteriovorax sp. BALOs_7]
MSVNHSSESKSLWGHAWTELRRDKAAVFSMIVIGGYVLLAVLTFFGVIAGEWSKEIGASYSAPSLDALFGTDIFGRSVVYKTLKGAEMAIGIGFSTATISTVIGVTLGLTAGYFGGKVDEFIVWFYTSMASIPYIMLLFAVTMVLGKGTSSLFLALGITSWVGLCRLVRGEVMRHKEREYVQAAAALGAGNTRRMFKHILPNIFHIVIIQFSLRFQQAIKSEVILSYLGLGVQGQPSWGTMIDDSKLELARGVWWQLTAATVAMFVLVLALNLLGDALRDSLDPKLKGKA